MFWGSWDTRWVGSTDFGTLISGYWVPIAPYLTETVIAMVSLLSPGLSLTESAHAPALLLLRFYITPLWGAFQTFCWRHFCPWSQEWLNVSAWEWATFPWFKWWVRNKCFTKFNYRFFEGLSDCNFPAGFKVLRVYGCHYHVTPVNRKKPKWNLRKHGVREANRAKSGPVNTWAPWYRVPLAHLHSCKHAN